MRKAIAHLNEVFRWSGEKEVEAAQLVASGLAVAVPILIALSFHRLDAGVAAAIGGMAMSGALSAEGLSAQIGSLGASFIPLAIAAAAASLAAGHGLATDAIVIALIVTAAMVGGYSRPMVAATTRFILFLVLTANMAGGNAAHRTSLFVLVISGALLAALFTFILGMAAHFLKPPEIGGSGQASQPTAQQKFTRWKRSLTEPAGWQYAGRLLICLSAAALLQTIFPDHHPQWVTLTVVILVQRPVERMPIKITQRAFGVAFGVCIAAGLLLTPVPGLMFALCAGVLAAARPLLRARNYMAYSAVMTPLMIMAIDAAGHLAPSLLWDRLVATFVAAGLVLVVNQAAFSLLPKAPQPANA